MAVYVLDSVCFYDVGSHSCAKTLSLTEIIQLIKKISKKPVKIRKIIYNIMCKEDF